MQQLQEQFRHPMTCTYLKYGQIDLLEVLLHTVLSAKYSWREKLWRHRTIKKIEKAVLWGYYFDYDIENYKSFVQEWSISSDTKPWTGWLASQIHHTPTMQKLNSS